MTAKILVGGRLVDAPSLAAGERMIVLDELGRVLVVSEASDKLVGQVVARAEAAAKSLERAEQGAITGFFAGFAARLAEPRISSQIAAANASDVKSAEERGRAVGRLKLTPSMLSGMVEGLRIWEQTPSRVGEIVESRTGDGFRL
jgi:gamma-glutamyl phosphate reductase